MTTKKIKIKSEKKVPRKKETKEGKKMRLGWVGWVG